MPALQQEIVKKNYEPECNLFFCRIRISNLFKFREMEYGFIIRPKEYFFLPNEYTAAE